MGNTCSRIHEFTTVRRQKHNAHDLKLVILYCCGEFCILVRINSPGTTLLSFWSLQSEQQLNGFQVLGAAGASFDPAKGPDARGNLVGS